MKTFVLLVQHDLLDADERSSAAFLADAPEEKLVGPLDRVLAAELHGASVL